MRSRPDAAVCTVPRRTVVAWFCFSGRNHRVHAPACGLLDDRIAVVAFIGIQMLGRDPFHQAASLRAICHGTLRDNDSERQTMRIHGQMYLGVEPPFVRLIA